MNNNIVAGVDIGGTHITAALIDLQSHSIIRDSLTRHPLNSKGTKAEILKEWAVAIKECKLCNNHTSNKIGIAMPGPFDYEAGISLIKDLDKYESLYLLNVKELLASELEIEATDIFMMNDASCFLKGEIFGGTSENFTNVIGITLGTGLGSAVGKNKMILDGDLYCTSYKSGTAEDYLSARWFVNRYAELTGETLKGVKEIKDRIPADPIASSLFIEFGENLGEVLSTYCKKHQAEQVIIGGNIIKAWGLFIPTAQKILEKHSVEVILVKAKFGEEASLMGAGSLCVGE